MATYKGSKYRLLWSGKTKYGERAKLAFFSGGKEFWVDASKVTIMAPTRKFTTPSGQRIDEDDVCELCGENKYTCGHCIGW